MQVWEEMRQNKSVGLYTWSLTLNIICDPNNFSACFNTAHFHDRFFYLWQRKSYDSHMILFLMFFFCRFCKKIFSYLTISTGLFRLFAFCAFTYNVLAKVLDYNIGFEASLKVGGRIMRVMRARGHPLRPRRGTVWEGKNFKK